MQAQQKPREDWFDPAYVSNWIDGQADRKDQRERQFARLRALVPRAPDESFRYLNVGSGPGRLDQVLLERFTHAHATLADGSSTMLDHARGVLGQFAGRTTFVRADFSASQWVDELEGGFDLAVSSIAIHNLHEPVRVREVYAEIFNLLADGGCFLNLEYVRVDNPSLRPLMRRAWDDPDAAFLRGAMGDRLAATVDEQLGFLREAGFHTTECFWRELSLALVGGFKGTLHLP